MKPERLSLGVSCVAAANKNFAIFGIWAAFGQPFFCPKMEKMELICLGSSLGDMWGSETIEEGFTTLRRSFDEEAR